jgi:hypothetical protein
LSVPLPQIFRKQGLGGRFRREWVAYRGAPFTREQLLTAAVFHQIDRPPPGSTGKGDCCRLLACIVGEKYLSPELEKRLKATGGALAGIRHCLRMVCGGAGR